ncbi:hypothetical protein ABTK72_20645, partial [Acinetobacter baumannii]
RGSRRRGAGLACDLRRRRELPGPHDESRPALARHGRCPERDGVASPALRRWPDGRMALRLTPYPKTQPVDEAPTMSNQDDWQPPPA